MAAVSSSLIHCRAPADASAPGTVFLGVHTTAGKPVAIKLEATHPEHHSSHPSPLKTESKIYKSLSGGTGVPWMLWSGRQGDYNVMVTDLLGPSLEDLFKMCNRHFSMKTVLLLTDQLVSVLFAPLFALLTPPHSFRASNSFTHTILSTEISSLRTLLCRSRTSLFAHVRRLPHSLPQHLHRQHPPHHSRNPQHQTRMRQMPQKLQHQHQA